MWGYEQGLLVITSKVKNLKSIHNWFVGVIQNRQVGNYLESKKFEINSQLNEYNQLIDLVGNYLESKKFEINSQPFFRHMLIQLSW